MYTAVFTSTLRELSRSSFVGKIHIRKNLYQKLEVQQYTYKSRIPRRQISIFSIIFCSLYDFLDRDTLLQDTVPQYMKHDMKLVLEY